MRCNFELSQLCNEVSGVVSTVRTYGRSPAPARQLLQHLHRCFPLGGPCGQRQARVNDKTVPVLRQNMSEIAELCFRSPGLLVQPRERICSGLMRIV